MIELALLCLFLGPVPALPPSSPERPRKTEKIRVPDYDPPLLLNATHIGPKIPTGTILEKTWLVTCVTGAVLVVVAMALCTAPFHIFRKKK